MNAIIVLAAAAAIGVDVGWHPLPDGGVEYIIQLEPELLNTLSRGQPVTSDPPSSLDVRRILIMVGDARLPQANEDASNRLGPRAPERQAVTAPAAPRSPAAEPAVVEPDPEPTVESTAEIEGPAMVGTPSTTRPAEQGSEREAQEPAARSQAAEVAGSRTPGRFRPDVASAPLGGKPVTFDDGSRDERPRLEQETLKPPVKGRTSAAATASTPQVAAPKPWLPLIATLLGFFLSLGGNIYLGWLFWDARNRYRGLLASFPGRTPQAT